MIWTSEVFRRNAAVCHWALAGVAMVRAKNRFAENDGVLIHPVRSEEVLSRDVESSSGLPMLLQHLTQPLCRAKRPKQILINLIGHHRRNILKTEYNYV